MKILIPAIALLALAACSNSGGARPTTSAQSKDPGTVGRYTITHSPNERGTQLLDTATGRTWQLVEDQGGGLSWVRIHRPQGEDD